MSRGGGEANGMALGARTGRLRDGLEQQYGADGVESDGHCLGDGVLHRTSGAATSPRSEAAEQS